MLAFLIKYRAIVAPALIALLAGGYIVYLRIDAAALRNQRDKLAVSVEQLRGERDTALAVANANADAVKRAQAERDSTIALLETERAKAALRDAVVQETMKEIENAPPSTCPAGARLDAAHRGLLRLIPQP